MNNNTMLQEIAVNQTSRKKILSRNDLISELEGVLSDLRERHQFSSLRSLSLDSFHPTDNPFFRSITLGDLATNPAEALRDCSRIERKEIASLIETLHLLNVRSDHSLSLIQGSFTKIESEAESVQQVLKDVLNAVLKTSGEKKVKPQDGNVAKLRSALRELNRSPDFDKIRNVTIENFWGPKASSCCILAGMTWQKLIETPPSTIFSLPNFGKARFINLMAAIKSAKTAAQDSLHELTGESTPNLITEARKAIIEGISEIKARATQSTINLSEVLQNSNPNALLTLFLAQATKQRKVGDLLGITESRVSQLMHEAHKDIADNLSRIDPGLTHRLEKLLASPACSEQTLEADIGLSGSSEYARTMVRIVAISLGASNPEFRGRVIKTHWTKSTQNFTDRIKDALSCLPMSSQSLAERISAALPGCLPADILAVIPPSAYFLKSRDCWYEDQEKALISVLRSSKKRMSAQQISAIFECGPRQMRYLLQNSKQITRIGLNNGRRYTVS